MFSFAQSPNSRKELCKRRAAGKKRHLRDEKAQKRRIKEENHQVKQEAREVAREAAQLRHAVNMHNRQQQRNHSSQQRQREPIAPRETRLPGYWLGGTPQEDVDESPWQPLRAQHSAQQAGQLPTLEAVTPTDGQQLPLPPMAVEPQAQTETELRSSVGTLEQWAFNTVDNDSGADSGDRGSDNEEFADGLLSILNEEFTKATECRLPTPSPSPPVAEEHSQRKQDGSVDQSATEQLVSEASSKSLASTARKERDLLAVPPVSASDTARAFHSSKFSPTEPSANGITLGSLVRHTLLDGPEQCLLSAPLRDGVIPMGPFVEWSAAVRVLKDKVHSLRSHPMKRDKKKNDFGEWDRSYKVAVELNNVFGVDETDPPVVEKAGVLEANMVQRDSMWRLCCNTSSSVDGPPWPFQPIPTGLLNEYMQKEASRLQYVIKATLTRYEQTRSTSTTEQMDVTMKFSICDHRGNNPATRQKVMTHKSLHDVMFDAFEGESAQLAQQEAAYPGSFVLSAQPELEGRDATSPPVAALVFSLAVVHVDGIKRVALCIKWIAVKQKADSVGDVSVSYVRQGLARRMFDLAVELGRQFANQTADVSSYCVVTQTLTLDHSHSALNFWAGVGMRPDARAIHILRAIHHASVEANEHMLKVYDPYTWSKDKKPVEGFPEVAQGRTSLSKGAKENGVMQIHKSKYGIDCSVPWAMPEELQTVETIGFVQLDERFVSHSHRFGGKCLLDALVEIGHSSICPEKQLLSSFSTIKQAASERRGVTVERGDAVSELKRLWSGNSSLPSKRTRAC